MFFLIHRQYMHLFNLFFAMLFLFSSIKAKAEPLSIGAPAPLVTGIDQDGNPVEFIDIYLKGLTLIYFYPKADTPGCTAEACSLRDAGENWRVQGLQIVGVSRDNVATQKKFHSKYSLPFTLISDPDCKIARAFRVPLLMGIYASRQSFLIKNGKIVWRSLKAETRHSAEEIQEAMALFE